MFISPILFVALLVGTFLYWNEFSGKTLRTYWSLLIGFILMPLFVPIVTVASFYAHAKMKSSGSL